MKRTVSLTLSALCFVMASGVYAQARGVPPGPPIFEAEIVNGSSNPVPVAGDVTASIDGEVEVSGSVNVDSLPQSHTDQLQEIIDALEALGMQGGTTVPAQVTYLSEGRA